METAQENKDLVVRLIDQVWNAGDLALAPEFFGGPMLAEAVGLHQTLTGAFPDLHIDIDDLIAEQDKVVARLTFRGTHHGAFRGIAPTARAVTFTAIRIYRFSGGKVTESWACQDAIGLLQQLRDPAPQPSK
jgi:hypothetical protein